MRLLNSDSLFVGFGAGVFVLFTFIPNTHLPAAEFISLGSLYDPAPVDPPRALSVSAGISDDGTTVIGFTPGANRAPIGLYPDVLFRWTRETGMQAITNDDYDFSAHFTQMSADGSTVVGAARVYDGLSDWEHFIWTEDTGFSDLNMVPGGDWTMSRDGSVVVGRNDDGVPTRWTAENGYEAFDTPMVDGNPEIRVSSDGRVIAGEVSQTVRIDDQTTQYRRTPIFRWTEEGGVETIGEVPGHDYHIIKGMSDDGTVLAGISGAPPFGTNGGDHTRSLWRWTQEEGLIVLANGGNDFTFRDNDFSEWLSADGSVLVGHVKQFDTGSVNAFRWTEETGLQLLPGADGLATSVVSDMTPDGKWLLGFSANPPNHERPWVPWLWSADTGILNLLEIFETQGLGPSIAGWEISSDGTERISADARAIIGNRHQSGRFARRLGSLPRSADYCR